MGVQFQERGKKRKIKKREKRKKSKKRKGKIWVQKYNLPIFPMTDSSDFQLNRKKLIPIQYIYMKYDNFGLFMIF